MQHIRPISTRCTDNNYCQGTTYGQANGWNFDDWDNWAKNTSPNKDVKVYIGVPGAGQSAGSGYLDLDKLAPIIQATQSNYSTFGGVMMWDVSSAYSEAILSSSLVESDTRGSVL